MVDIPRPRFTLGQIVGTPPGLAALEDAGENPKLYLERHCRGDWGDVDKHDARANDAAVKNGERILSAYTLKTGVQIWIITEWDRSVTTILLPSDY